MILYHVCLYFHLGVNPKTTWKGWLVSGFNFLLLRTLIVYTFPIMSFNRRWSLNIDVISQLTFFYLTEELYMYAAHRFMHWNKWLYMNIHSVHHEVMGDCFTTAMYMHPIEMMTHIFPDLMIGPTIIHIYKGWIYKEAMVAWMFLSTFYFIYSHSGGTLVSTKHHWLHHKYYNCNYGSIITDTIFRTCKN